MNTPSNQRSVVTVIMTPIPEEGPDALLAHGVVQDSTVFGPAIFDKRSLARWCANWFPSTDWKLVFIKARSN